jgi:hypothetical protein
MGARVIQEVSNALFAQFIKNFQAQLRNPSDAAEAKPLSAAAVAWAAAKGALHRNS